MQLFEAGFNVTNASADIKSNGQQPKPISALPEVRRSESVSNANVHAIPRAYPGGPVLCNQFEASRHFNNAPAVSFRGSPPAVSTLSIDIASNPSCSSGFESGTLTLTSAPMATEQFVNTNQSVNHDELKNAPLHGEPGEGRLFDLRDVGCQLALLSPCSNHRILQRDIETESNIENSICNPICDNRHLTTCERTDYTCEQKIPTLLPSVEDGLSSSNDLDSPQLTPCHQEHIPVQLQSSGSPDSDFMRNTSLCLHSSSHSPLEDSMLNSFILNDISNDIMAIKRALSSIERQPSGSVSKLDHSSGSGLTDGSTKVISSTGLLHNASLNQGQSAVCSMKSNQDGEDSVITVEAVIEHFDDEHIQSQGSENISGNCRSHISGDSPLHPHLEQQHWNFPTQSSNSSEDETSMNNHSSISKSHSKDAPTPIKCLTAKDTVGIKSQIQKNSAILSSKQINKFAENLEKLKLKNQNFNREYADHHAEFDSDEDTDQLLTKQYQSDQPVYIPELKDGSCTQTECKKRVREVSVRHPDHPDVLIHGLLFRTRYMGSTQILSERHPTRMSRMLQAQEVVNRIKAPEDESQPSVPVELFISTERLLILNTNLEDILIDHPLRTVSYIADIGELFVMMSMRPDSSPPKPNIVEDSDQDVSKTGTFESAKVTSVKSFPSKLVTNRLRTKMLCHVLESSEAQLIAQAVGHVFQLAYIEFLRENGVDDVGALKQLEYEEVLKQQEIFCDELSLYCDKEKHKEVIIPKQRGESLGIVIVESGWGSLLPTALLANMHPTGPAARCGQLNIGNQIMVVNGQSLVGLSLSACQQIIKNCRPSTAVKLLVIDSTPVVEVLIRRPNLNYQLGFSVQDGVVCSLLRGSIAERGGIRVDHRIIEINNQSVVAMPHETIVHLLSTAVGEIHIRTMPTSVFRLLTGQTIPRYL